jgi:hypothetical protein
MQDSFYGDLPLSMGVVRERAYNTLNHEFY